MKIATIICNHNYGHYLEDAINSALNQNIKTDIYVANDGSTDNSQEILKLYENKITYATIPEPVGPSEARNVLLNMTIDKYDCFAILDADDIMYPHKLEKCVDELFSDDNIGVVYADYDILNVDTGTLIREYKEPFDRIRLGQECIVHSGAVIKKEPLLMTRNNNGFYNRTMRTCEDYELWIRISKFFMISHIPESLTLVRNHQNNSTNTVSKEIWENNWRKVAEAYSL